MGDNNWRGSQYATELNRAKDIVRNCQKCGGTGIIKKEIIRNINNSAKKFNLKNIDELDELNEQVRLKENKQANEYSKNARENPQSSTFGLCSCRIISEHKQELIKGNFLPTLSDLKLLEIIHRDIIIVGHKKVDARSFAKYYLRKFNDAMDNGIGCNFFGQYSTGKTYLAQLLANHIISRRYTAHYIPLFLLIDTLSRANGNDKLFGEIMSTDLLIIDDIGSEQTFRKAACGELAYYLKQRINRRKITFYISNVFNNAEEMLSQYDSLFYNVITERNMEVQFKTKLFSKKLNQTRLDKFLKRAT
jgi:DNA replication protein DnaC